MFDLTIRRLLSLFPRGATNDQLIWRLANSGVRLSASELLMGLNVLVERGEVVRDTQGRWRSSAGPVPNSGGVRPAGPTPGAAADGILRAAPALLRSLASGFTAAASPQPLGAGRLHDWPLLATYYAATQRKDPRGRVKDFADRHGSGWQLFRTTGAWWSDTEIRIGMDHLPEEFREALSRLKTDSAAIGWPVSLFPTAEGPAFIPGLILPVSSGISDLDLVLTPEVSDPILNPAWIDEVVRRTGWTEASLLECLVPEGEDADLGAISDRMRHALATIGGACLRPGDLAPDLSIVGSGLRNAAGLFLPGDSTFTRGAAEDLETMRTWTEDVCGGTALEALLSEHDKAVAHPVSALQTSSANLLTDTQVDAVAAALAGSLTVIQGPPGTGKSQVILAFIVSAMMAGKTVLFAAKNHQAIDEVERRLAEIVPEAPLMTRARDSDGERNVSFLDVLAELARGETLRPEDKAARHARDRIVAKAGAFEESRRIDKERLSLQLELSDIVERLADVDLARLRSRRKSLVRSLTRFWRALRLRLKVGDNSHGPTGDGATVRQMLDRVTSLRERLDVLAIATRPDDEPLKAFADEVAAAAPAVARLITRPDEVEWRHLLDRSKELEFAKVKSVRRMAVEDARLVLRHRPVWAVSTLSAPSRIPLVPALFDYVVFDEASQCDIASALPLFGRARSAVVVGDPMQLRFVPSIGNASEHALMDAAGLPDKGRAAIAQGTNSLFDFCERRPAAKRMFLADQFRSAPSIVDYLNADFYSGRLISRRADESFRPPDGYRPGLAWADVPGHAERTDDGTINSAEADEIVRILQRFAADPGFSGHVGIISPFNAQIGKIERRIRKDLSPALLERLAVRVATVDKFQGGEADVVLFSLVVSASGPRSSVTFLQKERRRLNVAISRARALCIVVGDLAFARNCGIRHLEFLAQRATVPRTVHRPQQFDSDWERRLHTAMRARGLDPYPQYPVGSRYLDFALDPEGVKLDVEVDGRRWHTDSTGGRKIADRLRDAEMHARGWKVLRFWVHELACDMETCLDRIDVALARR